MPNGPLPKVVNDALRLRHDPAMRWIVGGKAAAGAAASPSQMGRFEYTLADGGEEPLALAALSGRWIRHLIGRDHGRSQLSLRRRNDGDAKLDGKSALA